MAVLLLFIVVSKIIMITFLYNYQYYSVVTKRCPNLYLPWCDTNPILKYERYVITLKVIFKVRKVRFGPLRSIWANISETCML